MKKKVFFIAALAAAVFTTNDVAAQTPEGGEKNIEVNFTPLGGAPISINNLRLRYFSSSDMAFRVGLSIVSNSSTDEEIVNAGTPTELTLEDKTSTFGLTINPGIEFHFSQTDRLSPYYGAEILFSTVSTTETDQFEDPGNAGSSLESEVTNPNGTDGTTFGLNLILGADWYFSEHIYMGTEVGFGFSTTSFSDTESTPPAGSSVTTPNGSNFNLGPNFNSAIRLGFLF
ncbi:MAG: hypothetical protein CMP59_07310 [Flavobacteriales bacterium]|nr:hypothetical protein [Flavobacteriales bacterium]|tara:strand:+ start:3353 stop:4039 length:687 start_codon:yes stop_codon:yes gene_type:complete